MTSSALAPIGARSRWLGHPTFATAVVLLAVNDHILKDRYPGWWTGKLSDIAGVAVVATMAAVLLGRRRGFVATAAAFVLLKTAPGLAEQTSPFLGGVTRRDHTDLVALLILFPLDWVFRTAPTIDRTDPQQEDGAAPAPVASSTARRIHRLVAAVAGIAPAFRAVTAVVATTATSCGPKPAVTEVGAAGAQLFAFVDRGWGEGSWAQSGDGGRTWIRSGPPPGRAAGPPSDDPYVDSPTGPTEACAGDVCYRIVDRRTVQRRSPDGTWRDEVRLSDEEFGAISTGCAGAQRGVLRSVAVAGTRGGASAVASLGAGGSSLARTTDIGRGAAC